MSLKIKSFEFNAFQENTFIVSDPENNAVIIDPGCYSRDEEQQLLTYINEAQLKVVALLNTHAHIDHIVGNSFIKENFKVDYYLHKDDINTLNAVEQYASLYGFEGYRLSPQPDILLEDESELVFGGIRMKVLHTPGHCPGHVVFYFQSEGIVINGDVLFNGSFGRTDLPGGNLEILKTSIFETMFSMPDNTLVYCGHGPSTTIGKERLSNYIHQF
jgi:glyoxylase-like metal-dependent hydrolase (beta-lactamase superfamily II)